jgi:hypothetical protein
MNNDPNQYSFREYPVPGLVFGLLFILGGFYLYWKDGQWILLAIASGVTLLIILLSTVLTVHADRLTGTLNISRRGLLRNYHREIYLHEIQSVQLGTSVSHDEEGSTSTTYRVEIHLKDGSVVPLRSSYSSGRMWKERKAKAFREFIGVDAGPAPGGILDFLSPKAPSQSEAESVVSDGRQAEMQVTQGIRWRGQSLSSRAFPISRWLTPDCTLPDHFLCLAQMPKGQKSNKLLQSMFEKFRAPSVLARMYGFSKSDAPNIEHAETVSLDGRLSSHFTAYTSDEQITRPILAAWERTSLSAWAEKYPVRQGFTRDEQAAPNQLVVLLGPNGLYLAVSSRIEADRLEEFVNLGVELAHWQR